MSKYFEPLGILGGVVMGGVVYYVNSEYGFSPASIAALKQATYTTLIGGSMMKLCENIAISFKNKNLSKVTSAIVPSAITIGLTYLVHSMKGTPEPFNSTIPTILIGPPVFAWWGNKKRNRLEEIVNESKL